MRKLFIALILLSVAAAPAFAAGRMGAEPPRASASGPAGR